jgi:DNA-binding response OmpR family regulator
VEEGRVAAGGSTAAALENWFGSTKTLDVTMAGLRRRLTHAAATSARPSSLPRITTLRGHGYRLEL